MKLTGPELEWAKKAMNGQGNVVLKLMYEEPKKHWDKDSMLAKVNKAGYAWEEHHVNAAFRNLKERGLVEQKKGFTFMLKEKA